MHRTIPDVIGLVGMVALATSAFAQPASDHLACYLVKDSARKGSATLTLTNVAITQSCTIVVPTPPRGGPERGNVGDFLCHRLVCPRPFPPAAQMTDQFGGTRVVRFRDRQQRGVGEHPGLGHKQQSPAINDIGDCARAEAHDENGKARRTLHEGDHQRGW